MKEGLAKIVLIGGAASLGTLIIAERLPSFTNPLDAIGGAAGNAWGGLEDALGSGKGTADRIVDGISRRDVKPLDVKPEDVVSGAITGQVAFGRSEREYTVSEASKEYDSSVPEADEWVKLYDAHYRGEAYVPGPIKIEHEGKELTITLPGSVLNPNTVISKEPNIVNKPQPLAQAGQLPGSETDTTPAKEELNNYMKELIEQDVNLRKSATCWGIKSVYELASTALGASGISVITDNNASNMIPNIDGLMLRVEAPDVVYESQAIRSSMLNMARCQNILAATWTPESGDQVLTLPMQSIKKITLNRVNK